MKIIEILAILAFFWPKKIFSAHLVVLVPRNYPNLSLCAISGEIKKFNEKKYKKLKIIKIGHARARIWAKS